MVLGQSNLVQGSVLIMTVTRLSCANVCRKSIPPMNDHSAEHATKQCAQLCTSAQLYMCWAAGTTMYLDTSGFS